MVVTELSTPYDAPWINADVEVAVIKNALVPPSGSDTATGPISVLDHKARFSVLASKFITGLYPRISIAPDGNRINFPSSLNIHFAVARVNVGDPVPFCSAMLPRSGQ